MTDVKDINKYVLDILSEEIKDTNLDFNAKIDLSSIQILKVLANIEKKFQIEVDDKYVFHGLFSSGEILSSYICNKLGISENEYWKESII